MATLINLGFAGINADYIACWEDNPQEGELYVIMAVPYLHMTYRDHQRRQLLEYLERPAPKDN